jgi:hypothetical protein
MAKRRTKRQKQQARHEFTISWEPNTKKQEFEANVKGQFQKESTLASAEAKDPKNAKFSAQELDLPGIKRNIKMSLIYTGLILTAEIVLYFIWNVR